MDVPQHFRSAINGFRREDVVRYLEYLNAKHTTELNQLSSESDSLRQKIQQLEDKLSEHTEAPDCSSELEQLRSQLEEANKEKDSLKARVQQLESTAKEEKTSQEDHASIRELQDLKDRCAELQKELAAKEEAEKENLAGQELEAYRRAERAERIANEKADLIYHRANGILTQASGKIDGVSGDLTELADRINGQLQQLQYTINSSKSAISEAAKTIHDLHIEDK